MVTKIKEFTGKHPDIWQFILFNILSNCATITNFVVMWVCTGWIFKSFSTTPFKFWVFDYSHPASDLGLCGFISFLLANALAQTVNFFVQKNLVFKSNEDFTRAVPKFILLAVICVLIPLILTPYSSALFRSLGLARGIVPTAANIVNILLQVVLSFPLLKFWIMPEK
ncbi:MAG: GtrA family protein [Lachnospiraceae bacterium]|nr:GtrA family protein [Lachnospiraceae bacterium]